MTAKNMSLLIFQSTLLMRGATPEGIGGDDGRAISIHAPHARSDSAGQAQNIARTAISIHAPHARSDATSGNTATVAGISIHAPHARSDGQGAWRPLSLSYDFNPRSSCEERHGRRLHSPKDWVFQSTLLMRGATRRAKRKILPGLQFQSTLLMRGATSLSMTVARRSMIFQSTLLMRGATGRQIDEFRPLLIFQSTLLMRGATTSSGICQQARLFQSTLLMRGATQPLRASFSCCRGYFNPRSSCEERPARRSRIAGTPRNFNPRSSCEERHDCVDDIPNRIAISIHAPHARSDADMPTPCVRATISIHAPHARSDR